VNQTRLTDGQDGQTDVLSDETLPIDQPFAFGKLHDLADGKPDQRPDGDAESDLVQPGDVEPLSNGVSVVVVDDQVERQVCVYRKISLRPPESSEHGAYAQRKGNAAPSFDPDSACNKCRICAGTCLSANLPPTTAWAKIGSVGVRQAAMARAERNSIFGKMAQTNSAETSQPHCATRMVVVCCQ
jgi:hypothetical protein